MVILDTEDYLQVMELFVSVQSVILAYEDARDKDLQWQYRSERMRTKGAVNDNASLVAWCLGK